MDDMQPTDNDDEFRRNADGTITATGGKKGGDTTDYLYDAKGKLIGSKSVTVLEAGDNMSADYSTYGLRLHTEGTGLSVSEGLTAAALEFSGVKILQNLKIATGGLKQWIRTGPSYSIEGGFKTFSTRWGAGGTYWKKIGNTTLQNWNKAFRQTKLPGNNWRVKDPGHFHWKKTKP